MGRAHDGRDVPESGRSAEDALADEWVLAYERPLALVERARFVQDLVRDGELAEVVELCGAQELVELLPAQPELETRLDRQRSHAVQMQIGLAKRERLEQRVRRAIRLHPPPVLLGVQPLVSQMQRVARVARLPGKQDGAERAADLEADPTFREGGARLVDDRLGLTVCNRYDESELVAAEPVCTSR
ncbi:hypothetical protein BH20ACT13_BH20ACT13_08120 [soil metagenome]